MPSMATVPPANRIKAARRASNTSHYSKLIYSNALQRVVRVTATCGRTVDVSVSNDSIKAGVSTYVATEVEPKR